MTTLIVVLKSPFKLVCFVYPVRHFQGNLPFDFSQTMHMDRRPYTKHGLPVHGPPLWTYNPGQTSLGQCCNIHIFLSFLCSLLKQCTLFKIFLQFSLFPPYTKLKLWKNSGYTHPTLFVGWGEGLGLCELENAPEMQKCPKTFVNDCSPWIPLWTWAWTTPMDHPYFWRWILLEVYKTNLKNIK